MIVYQKIYRTISILSVIVHICVFAFVIAVGFLPFRESLNYYECFIGFFGKTLSAIQPYIIMGILFLTCISAFFTIWQPSLSLLVLILTVTFFVIILLPYSIDEMVIGFASAWIGGNMPMYGKGFELMCAASYIIYFDIIFFICSVVELIFKRKKSS